MIFHATSTANYTAMSCYIYINKINKISKKKNKKQQQTQIEMLNDTWQFTNPTV